VFLGTHSPRLDDKGRLALPAKFRDELAEGLVIAKGQERCLYVFPAAEFQRISDRARSTPIETRERRFYQRLLFASAVDEVPDRQGRVMVPQALREYAGLDRDVVVIGMNSRAEIWSPGAWEAFVTENEDDYARLSEELMPSS
jgi:MraZ protein